MVTARAGGVPNVISVFNDRSGRPLPSGPLDFEIALDNSKVTHRKGVTVVGWATSLDGTNWNYRGKLDTPPGWAALLGDPTVAVDFTNPAVVYAATLALDNAGWVTQFGSAQSVTSPDVPEPNGFCVRRSTDGGITFPQAGCVAVPLHKYDKTAIAVDGTGRAWVASEDRLNSTIGIWRSLSAGATWSTFNDVTPQCDPVGDPFCSDPDKPIGFLGDFEPRLQADDFGDIWLLSVDQGTAGTELRTVSWNSTTQIADGYFSFTPACGLGNVVSNTNPIVGGKIIRNAFRYTFGVGLTNRSRDTAIRVAYEYEISGKRHVQALEVSNDQPGQCAIIPGWDSVSAGAFGEQQFQASLSYQYRGVSAGGIRNPEWWLGFIHNGGVPNVNDTYLGFVAAPLNDFGTPGPLPGGIPTPTLLPFVLMTPSNYYACVRNGGYWGDYFGITQFNTTANDTGWKTVSTFPDSRPAPPCVAQAAIGAPMQIAAFTTELSSP